MTAEPALASPTQNPPIAAQHEAVSAFLASEAGSGLWRGTQLGSSTSETIASGWNELDSELPDGGWPCRSLTEVLCPQPSILEFRLTGPALRSVVAEDGQVVIVGAPKDLHLPGLLHEGFDQRHLVWIQAEAQAERLWVIEQLIRSNSAGAVLAWVPHARQEQIRRLQISAQACDGLVFLFRPEGAQHEASAAPLRLHVSVGVDWELKVSVFKRRGPVHDGVLSLASIPGGLSSVLTPRARRPSRLIAAQRKEFHHVVGRPATDTRRDQVAVS